MKRLLVFVLALMLAGAALGEGAAFPFDESISWGMASFEVQAALGDSADAQWQSMEAGMELISVDDASFEGVEADALFMFKNGMLVMVGYVLEREDAAPEDVKAALDARFGDHADGGAEAYMKAMQQLTGIMYYMPPNLEETFVNWALPDGCHVLLGESMDLNGGTDVEEFAIICYDDATIENASSASLSEPAPAFDPEEG